MTNAFQNYDKLDAAKKIRDEILENGVNENNLACNITPKNSKTPTQDLKDILTQWCGANHEKVVDDALSWFEGEAEKKILEEEERMVSVINAIKQKRVPKTEPKNNRQWVVPVLLAPYHVTKWAVSYVKNR